MSSSPAEALLKQLPFSPSLFNYRRRPTRTVMVGNVGVGGNNPLRLQSMTTTRAGELEATVAQIERLVQAGCEIVRLTVPNEEEARQLQKLREGLDSRRLAVPLVADIHFRPEAALAAAEYVEKVRINPGNYADVKLFKTREYTPAQYEEELARVEEKFSPLVLKLKRLKRALRIGTNHGSLSDRILNRYGDTPEGMVESALEFVRVCRKLDFHDVILSMKSSNPKVTIAAYRLLAARMTQEGMDYPFHLGVTEAGFGTDGRIRSAIGIGGLLEDGIGDTLRVSLTEEPELEIPVGRRIASRYERRTAVPPSVPSPDETLSPVDDFYHYRRRPAREVPVGPFRIGGTQTIRVALGLPKKNSDPRRRMDSLEKSLRGSPDQPPEMLEWRIS
ncbi:MAG TPA: (E)-4-hydroxy-3-methylbut-2-enyl-diphosphate synthase, partial [Elusimicrobiota bacterium]|nr:(E)-4-hydroxy-3-methylbut-2-enyl-diphosphate synthase [Elusimicrobiota bacterium]